jgi:predicted TIM-barrel fold metal-dependent hydrolase
MYKNHTVIDTHGHISTPPQFRAYAYNLIVLRNAAEPLVISDEAMRPALDRHLRLLDAQGIDLQLLSPRPVAMMHWERPFLVDAWTRVTNDLIARQCRLHPDRFQGVAQLPQTRDGDMVRCADELERCVKEHAFVGAIVNPDPGADRASPGLNARYWDPLYERAQALDVTLVVHPSLTRDPRLDGIPNAYQYNNLAEETLATLLLEKSDVFARFPRLRIVVCHCGGAPRRMLEFGTRLDCTNPSFGPDNMIGDSGEVAGGQVGSLFKKEKQPPPNLDANLYFDTCAYDPHFLAAALKQRGAHRMVFGTEVPGSGSDLKNPRTGVGSDNVLALLDSFEFLSDTEKIDIVHYNPLRVFPRIDRAKIRSQAAPQRGPDLA